MEINGQLLFKDPGDEALFQADMRFYIECVITALDEHFPDDQFMQHCSVIDPSDSLLPNEDEELVDYGSEAMTYLADVLEGIVVQEMLEEEWKRFKFIKFPTTPLELAKKSPFNFYQQYSSAFPELWKLVQILLVLPVNTAACERWFSLMNVVIEMLSVELLDKLMVVSRKGRK